MSGDFIVNDHDLGEDFSLIKKLEYQHLRLEEKAAKSKQEQKLFCAHPKRILSDSESTVSNSSRSCVNGGGGSDILHCENDQFVYQERKKKAQTIRKKLHEKLSVIGQTGLEQAEISPIGDHANVSKESINDRFRTIPVHGGYDTSSGDSVDFGDVYSIRKNDKPTKAKTNTKTSEQQKPRSPSKVQGCYNKGLTILDYEKKCKMVLERSVQAIIDIRTLLAKGVTPPDGQEDELRRAVRIKEFFNRFSRNYLYPLSRQVKELSGQHQMAEPLIKQKLLASHQIVLNGLQAYQSHLTTSGGDTSFNQLKILMSNIMEICDLHRGINKNDDYINEFIDSLKLSADLTLQHVNELHRKPVVSVTESALKSEASNLSLSKYGMNSNRKLSSSRKSCKHGKKGSAIDKRYSMYTATASFRKDVHWKRTVENLAKKKFNVKSKYKTATYKHRPPLQKTPDILSLPQLKIVNSKKSGVLNSTPLHTPINEDAIKTMVQELDNNQDDEKLKDQENPKEEMLIKLLQYTLRQHQEGKCLDDTHLNEILKLMQDEPNIDDIKTILGRVVSEKTKPQERQDLTLKITQSDCTDLSSGVKSSREKSKRKEPTITVTGEKNARLICITDDNSIIEPEAETEATIEKICQTDDVEPTKILIRPSSQTQTDFSSPCPKVSKVTQKGKQNTCVKISRLKKSFRQLQHLDKKQAVSAIQYKLDFYRYCKSNPMYKKSTSCQPWLLMNKISEEILNHCLLAVAGEIEVNDIVDRVYQAELQL